MKPDRAANEADVYRNDEHVGTIRRTATGSIFRYTDPFFAEHKTMAGGVALHLPYEKQQIETRGYNLHPYFAGLLPEGLRLKALVSRAKTSEDDMLTLLVAAGSDTVGDIFIVSTGRKPNFEGVKIEQKALEKTRFADLWLQSIRHPSEDDIVIAGVQEKISPAMISFPVVGHSKRKGYILKLNPPDKPQLVENEAFFMQMARDCGIATAKTKLVRDRDRESGLLVERFDRAWDPKRKRLERIHAEDACQLLDRYPADKYRVNCSDIATALEVCAAPVPARAGLIRLIAFSYVVCNGDLHAKNISVIDSPIGRVLSPAYDILATLPYGDRSMALQFEGRDDNFRRKYFVQFGGRFGVPARAVESLLDALCARAGLWLDRLDEIGLSSRKQADLKRTMSKRLADLAS